MRGLPRSFCSAHSIQTFKSIGAGTCWRPGRWSLCRRSSAGCGGRCPSRSGSAPCRRGRVRARPAAVHCRQRPGRVHDLDGGTGADGSANRLAASLPPGTDQSGVWRRHDQRGDPTRVAFCLAISERRTHRATSLARPGNVRCQRARPRRRSRSEGNAHGSPLCRRDAFAGGGRVSLTRVLAWRMGSNSASPDSEWDEGSTATACRKKLR